MQWLEAFTTLAQENLTDKVRESLWMRGCTDEQIDLFRIGYLDTELPDLDYEEDFLDWAWHGRKLDDVFVFPLTNTLGQVKGFQFRHVDQARTGYMDFISSEDEAVLFGLGPAMPHVWETERLFLVEGVFDLFPIHRHYPDSIATLTARVTSPLLAVMRRLVSEAWLGYDNDPTGQRAMSFFERHHGDEFRVHQVKFPRVQMVGGGRSKDPSDLWEAWGDTRLGVFLQRQRDPYLIEEN